MEAISLSNQAFTRSQKGRTYGSHRGNGMWEDYFYERIFVGFMHAGGNIVISALNNCKHETSKYISDLYFYMEFI